MARTKVKPERKVTAKVTRKKLVAQPTFDESVLKDKTYIYKVESGVILAGVRSGTADIKFPFAQMNVGDSFLIPAKDPIAKSANQLHYSAKIYARFKPGFTITSRLQLDGSRRVWRLK